MSAKNKKLEIFRSFKKSKGEFLAGRHPIFSNKRLLNTSLHLC